MSVPHAGTWLGAAAASLRVDPEAAIAAVADPFADRLLPVGTGAGWLVAHAARVLIDLNRDERDLDRQMVTGWEGRTIAGFRQRAGLGLIPRHTPDAGALWQLPLSHADVAWRIEQVHRPYHAALATLLKGAGATHGHAVLLDIHSMPPIAGCDLVVGTRHGRSAQPGTVATVLRVAAAAGLAVTCDRPYAGGHTLERHAGGRVDAVQLEWNRALYLDRDGTLLPDAVARIQRVLAALVIALDAPAVPLAAE